MYVETIWERAMKACVGKTITGAHLSTGFEPVDDQDTEVVARIEFSDGTFLELLLDYDFVDVTISDASAEALLGKPIKTLIGLLGRPTKDGNKGDAHYG